MKLSKFNWTCVNCGAKNITQIKFQFDVPQHYTVVWTCWKCSKKTEIDVLLGIRMPCPPAQEE